MLAQGLLSHFISDMKQIWVNQFNSVPPDYKYNLTHFKLLFETTVALLKLFSDIFLHISGQLLYIGKQFVVVKCDKAR